jgi:hypothetical protein
MPKKTNLTVGDPANENIDGSWSLSFVVAFILSLSWPAFVLSILGFR